MQIFMVDSSPLLDERLRNLFSELPNVEIAGQSQNLEDAIQAISLLKPDVAMIDVHLLGRSGLNLMTTLTRDEQAPFVMVLASDASGSYQATGTDSGTSFLLYNPSDLG